MSREFIEKTARVFKPEFKNITDIDELFDACDSDKKWLPYLLTKAGEQGVEFVIRDARGWPQTPPRKPFQLEILTPDDKEFCAYVVGFFGTEEIARRFAERKQLKVREGLVRLTDE